MPVNIFVFLGLLTFMTYIFMGVFRNVYFPKWVSILGVVCGLWFIVVFTAPEIWSFFNEQDVLDLNKVVMSSLLGIYMIWINVKRLANITAERRWELILLVITGIFYLFDELGIWPWQHADSGSSSFESALYLVLWCFVVVIASYRFLTKSQPTGD